MNKLAQPLNRTFAGIAFLMAVFAAPSFAADVELEAQWQKHWRNYARRCVKLGDEFFSCAAYNANFPSSRGVTLDALRQKTAKEVTEKAGANVKVRKYLIRPFDELDLAAKALPELALGQYGYVHSAEVLEIKSSDVMMVTNLWLIDAEALKAAREKEEQRLLKAGADRGDMRTVLDWVFESRDAAADRQRGKDFRTPLLVKGLSTAGLAKGDRWQGPADKGIELAIVSQTQVPSRPGSSRTVAAPVAVPVSLFARGLTEESEFLAYLKSRGQTKETFVALVTEIKKQFPTDERLADGKIFEAMEKREEKAGDEGKPKK